MLRGPGQRWTVGMPRQSRRNIDSGCVVVTAGCLVIYYYYSSSVVRRAAQLGGQGFLILYSELRRQW